jgi:L-cystine uptake protein TcyP (sodium:dicarboxylate symporter family)
MLLLLAATTLEKIQAVPTKVWINVILFIVLFFVVVILIKKAAEMNKAVLAAIIFVVISSVGFNWVYSRNEPEFMTPFIEPLAKFFPSVGKQAEKEKRTVVP